MIYIRKVQTKTSTEAPINRGPQIKPCPESANFLLRFLTAKSRRAEFSLQQVLKALPMQAVNKPGVDPKPLQLRNQRNYSDTCKAVNPIYQE